MVSDCARSRTEIYLEVDSFLSDIKGFCIADWVKYRDVHLIFERIRFRC
jgi:hypothetical protein